ncbi:MAG: hypothetical protein KGJ07_02615 [Patescibacteria group bacterium]|nr:hypothetical protein [Patescibacteria group bacterium]MDE2590526.1 hypothetical protein [Patescibacteria group bacterium]
MPSRKKSSKARQHKTVQKPHISSSMGPTYDTQMIITILLLLFVYPLGLIFMWAWMRTWPLWLKIVISLPFALSIFVIILMLLVVGSLVRNGRFDRMMYEQQYRRQMMQQQLWNITPTPATNNTY